MERKNTGKKYNNEFKKTIANLYHSGNSVKELSGEYVNGHGEKQKNNVLHISKSTSKKRV
ncbi:hypothetical protein ACIQYG_10450 [Peribacillus sp. NPDC096622]|uniref:hypothetical protein n=1 Tax=Peribacillus sp. NPDC096622 TaxID=3364396 RepID=UPI0037F9BE4D